MKFSPTSLFSSLCNGASKYLLWKCYIKKTTDLSEALTAGTWLDVTNRVEIPAIAVNIEAAAGSSTSDRIQLQGDGIVWWQAQVFNATAAQYIEVKITCQLGLSENKLATDVCYEFYGYAEKRYTIQETTDTITFEVYSADDLLGRIPAENLSKQVKVADLDGAGLEGIYLQGIPGVYPVDANITSYVLHQGTHEIRFGYADGAAQLSLDGGEPVEPAEGLNTLSNDDDTQRLQVYCKLAEFLPDGDTQADVIVMTAGTTLPLTWLSGLSVKDALTIIYAFIGLTDFTFDDWTLSTYDGRRVTSFFEVPPSGTYYGRTNAIAYHQASATLYLGVKDRLYTRNMSTNAYELVGTPLAGWNIKKIWTERLTSESYLWLWLESGSSNKVSKFFYDGSSTTNTAVTAAYVQSVCYASALGTWGSLLFHDKAGATVKRFDLYTLAESTRSTTFTDISAITALAAGATDGTDYFTFGLRLLTPFDAVLVKITATTDVILKAVTSYALEMEYNGDFVFSYAGVAGIWSYNFGTGILASVDSAGEMYCPFYLYPDIHFVRKVGTENRIAYYSAGAVTSETESINYLTDGIAHGQQMAYIAASNKNVFVSNAASMLGQFYTTVSVFISPEAAFREETLRSALDTILESYMMLGKISAAKKVAVYRKFDAVGTVKTSGSTFAVTINEAEEIVKQVRYSEAVKWLEVSNGTETHSYDGTNWDQKLFTAERKLSVTAKLLPSNIVKDVCYYLWQFYSVDHHLYELPLANATPLHLEPFDGLAITFTGNRVAESGTAVVYGVSVEQDGYMKVKALK